MFHYETKASEAQLDGLGEMIERATRLGLTRAEIAKAAGCSRTQLWRLENEQKVGMSRTARKVSAYLAMRLESEPTDVEEALRAIARNSPRRERLMFHMLQIMAVLTSPPEVGEENASQV